MKKTVSSAKAYLNLAILGLAIGHVDAADLESVYNQYLQGNYNAAQKELAQLIEANPQGEKLLEMKNKLGVRALLEMSQNQFLREQMKLLNSATWQVERSQFKSPRRIQFFLDEFMKDDSSRQKSMTNITAAGMYAVPLIIEYLKVENENLESRGLAYQLLLNMGQEIVPALLPCTFSKDPVLQVSVLRLLAVSKSPSAIPYLLRLKTLPLTELVKEELDFTLAKFAVPSELTPAKAYIQEANRILSEGQGVRFEAYESDRVLWLWDEAQQKLVTDNPLGLTFEYHPQYPITLWPIFRAELMHREFFGLGGMSMTEEHALHAATLCTWVMQESRVQEILKDPKASDAENIAAQLKTFLDLRIKKLNLAQWLGQDILLQAVDMAKANFPTQVSARILRIIASYQPMGAENKSINSFSSSANVQPLIHGMSHRDELVRYWSAISIARCDKSLSFSTTHAPQVIDLLQQAIDEVPTPTVLLFSKLTNSAELVQKKLQDMGYFVQRREDGFAGLNELRTFPSKDLVIVDPDFDRSFSGLELINKLRKDTKGKDLPVIILSDAERSGAHVITFQEQAQQMIYASDSIETLREKFAGLVQKRFDVHGPVLAEEVSREALTALAFMDDATLCRFPTLVDHLIGLLNAPQQAQSSQILAIRILRKMGTLSAPAASLLLARLGDSQFDINYKLVVLHSLLAVAPAHEQVRAKLFEIINDDKSPDSFKQMAASYLSGEYNNLKSEERLKFQKTFFSPSFLGKSGS